MTEVISKPQAEETSSIEYSAFGYLWGLLKLDDEIPNQGELHLADGTVLSTSLRSNIIRASQQDQIESDKPYLWKIYFRTDSECNLFQLQVIECRVLKNVTSLSDETPSSASARIDRFRIRGQIHNIWRNRITLRLERNNIPPYRENHPLWRPFFITVLGYLEPRVNKGDYWQVIAAREGKQLHLLEASPMSQIMVEELHQKKLKKKQSQNKSGTSLIMLDGKIPEISVKFTTRPDIPATGKKVTLQITGENGVVVKADLNRKTVQKQVEKMDSYSSWVAALSGKIAQVNADGVIELDKAGLTVFEKKSKDKPPSEDEDETEQNPET